MIVSGRWVCDFPGGKGAEPVTVALTIAGSAFHKAGPKENRTRCGARIEWTFPFGEVQGTDYCRRCWGPGYFRREPA